MVLYANQDDYGSIPGNYLSYFFGSNTEAIACCNIELFRVRGIDTDESEDDDASRKLNDEDEFKYITPEEYKEIFGVEYDPADWTPEAFAQWGLGEVLKYKILRDIDIAIERLKLS